MPNNVKLSITGNEWRLINSFKEIIKNLNSTLKEMNKILEKLANQSNNQQIIYSLRNELKEYIKELLLK